MKIHLSLIFCFFSLGTWAQDTVLNNSIKFAKPYKAVSIHPADIHSYRKKMGLPEDSVSGKEVVYNVEGITMTIASNNVITPHDALIAQKYTWDKLGSSKSVYTSEIKAVNNREFLIIEYREKPIGKFIVYSTNKTHTILFAAVIEYPFEQQQKAKAIIDQLIYKFKYTKD